MKIFLIVSVLLGLALFLFGCWGRFSKNGKIKFDEMAGMIPFGAYYLGIILVIIVITISLFKYFGQHE